MKTELKRFLEAQESGYSKALNEIKTGRKQSHWMWFVFPQIAGLGFSETSRFFAIRDLAEAQDYLDHPVLGTRLREISHAVLTHRGASAARIFGSPDDIKLRSSMTLFASLERSDPVFQDVLDEFFKGEKDELTARMLLRI